MLINVKKKKKKPKAYMYSTLWLRLGSEFGLGLVACT